MHKDLYTIALYMKDGLKTPIFLGYIEATSIPLFILVGKISVLLSPEYKHSRNALIPLAIYKQLEKYAYKDKFVEVFDIKICNDTWLPLPL